MDNLPNIIVSDNHNSPAPSFWDRYKKLIFFIVGVIIVSEVVWAAYSLTHKSTQSSSTQSGASTTSTPSASLSVDGPDSVNKGDNFTVTLKISSLKPTDGFDLILDYDPKKLSIVTGSNKTPVATTTTYSEYPSNVVDETIGRINLTGVVTLGSKGFSGSADLGTITFKALTSGSADIKVNYQPQSDKDSNVVDSATGRDILENVTNLKVNIN